MTQSRFFQISLSLPVLLWCLSLTVLSIVYKQGADFILKNTYDAYRVFVPYLIFAGVIWKKAKDRPYRTLMLMASVVPIVWGVFFTIFYVLMTYIREQTAEKWYVLCIMAFWATVVAYLVEIVPFLILAIFKDSFRSVDRKTKS